MTDYPVSLTTADIHECARFMTKYLRKRERRGVDSQQAFFVLLSAFMAANAEAMLNVGFDEGEVRSIFAQASAAGLKMREFKVVPN